jgi:hypothetical protein
MNKRNCRLLNSQVYKDAMSALECAGQIKLFDISSEHERDSVMQALTNVEKCMRAAFEFMKDGDNREHTNPMTFIKLLAKATKTGKSLQDVLPGAEDAYTNSRSPKMQRIDDLFEKLSEDENLLDDPEKVAGLVREELSHQMEKVDPSMVVFKKRSMTAF